MLFIISKLQLIHLEEQLKYVILNYNFVLFRGSIATVYMIYFSRALRVWPCILSPVDIPNSWQYVPHPKTKHSHHFLSPFKELRIKNHGILTLKWKSKSSKSSQTKFKSNLPLDLTKSSGCQQFNSNSLRITRCWVPFILFIELNKVLEFMRYYVWGTWPWYLVPLMRPLSISWLPDSDPMPISLQKLTLGEGSSAPCWDVWVFLE